MLQNLQEWQKTQDNGLILYEKFPNQNLATDIRKEPLDFKKFVNYKGNVLDIGSGLEVPSYLKGLSNTFCIGIDPFVKKQSREKNIVLMQTIAEHLPFSDKLFDCITFATSFDHVIEPEIVLSEVKRVLKDDGKAIFWVESEPKKPTFFKSLKSKGIRKIKSKIQIFQEISVTSPSEQEIIIENLEKPTSAIDKFHLRHIRENDFIKLANRAGFKKIAQEIHPEYYSVFLMFLKA